MAGNSLAGFEDRIQRLVEGGLARLLAGRLHPREVAVQLARAMEDHAVPGANGESIAPDTFLVRLNPRDQRAILDVNPHLASTLSEELVDLARRSNLLMLQEPHIKLLADASIEMHHVAVAAYHSGDKRDSTESMGRDVVWGIKESTILHATLILYPDQSIPLDRPVINLGRNRDNHIIVDNPNVSRRHAQIRLRFGHYMLFDLGSASGTTVNGQPIREAILQSGDVIGLAGTSLIYIEESVLSPDEIATDESDTSALD